METITSLINRIDPSARIDGEQIILSTNVESEWPEVRFDLDAKVESLAPRTWRVADASGSYRMEETPNGDVVVEDEVRVAAEDAREARDKALDSLVYACTVEAIIGTHSSGCRITEYRDIRVDPSDLHIEADQDLTDPEVYAWWERVVNAMGDYMVLEATRTAEELDAIAQKAEYEDWEDAQRAMGYMDLEDIASVQVTLKAAADALDEAAQ